MRFKNFILSFGWALIMLFLTMLPGKKLPDVNFFGIDKVVHLGLYSVLMFLLLFEFSKKVKPHQSGFGFISFQLCFLYGLLIEILQLFVPDRSFSLLDLVANTLGTILGYLFFKLLFKTTSPST